MKLSRGIFLTLTTAAVLVFAPLSMADIDKLSPALQEKIASAQAAEMHSVLVYLTDQVDILNLDRILYDRKVTRRERHEIVVTELQFVAERSQPDVMAHLDLLQSSGEIEGWTAYWITNCFVVNGTESALMELAERSDIDYLENNFRAELIEPIRGPERSLDDDANTPPPGIVAIRAPEVWYQLGVTGAGALVANLDTGVEGTHPALNERWRGNFAPASECWRSPVNGSGTPVDNNNHGTHVMGTMCGATNGGTGDTVGVAPAALWIADDAIDQGVSAQLDSDILDAFQWFIDPDNNPGTVEDVPDVVQNSWGVYSGFTGYSDCDNRWDVSILALEAAGTVVTFSAGNEGPGSQTHRSPANAIYDSVSFVSIGAVDTDPANSFPWPIASFSSRGPSDCDGATIKPEVSAPGVNIYSSVPGGGYNGTYSGTSMAGPHVAGIVGLMRSANPNIEVRDIKSILMRTARDEGTAGEDNTYGHGFVDAYECVIRVIAGYGRIIGTVRDAETMNPIPALVEVVGGAQSSTAGPTGEYTLVLPGDSTYTLRYSLYGYFEQEIVVAIVGDDTTTQDANLNPRPVIVAFAEDFESGAPGWTHEAAAGPWSDQWHLSTERAHAGTQSYKCGDTGVGNYANSLDARLISPVVTNIPPDARLVFWSDIGAEVSGAFPDSAYDGGIVEISADAGPFVEVTPLTGYPKIFRYTSGGGTPVTGPMPGLPCLSSVIAWMEYNVDLTSYEGQDLQLRFRFGSDGGAVDEGWYVDDIEIAGLGTATVVPPTGLVISVIGTNIQLTWDEDINPSYEVYSSTLSDGPFSTLEGSTTLNEFLIINGTVGDDLKFYVVVGTESF